MCINLYTIGNDIKKLDIRHKENENKTNIIIWIPVYMIFHRLLSVYAR